MSLSLPLFVCLSTFFNVKFYFRYYYYYLYDARLLSNCCSVCLPASLPKLYQILCMDMNASCVRARTQ